jgi:hypothetical protein
MTVSLSQSLGGGTPEQWALDFAALCGLPNTDANRLVLVSWQWAESGGGGGMWNPLNTTQPGFGGVPINLDGVRNYPSRLQ